MDIRRTILYAVLAFIVYNLWLQWQHDYPVAHTPTTTTNAAPLPVVPDNTAATQTASVDPMVHAQPEITQTSNKAIIQVKTDVLDLSISPYQGTIVNAALLDYPENINNDKPFLLLQSNANKQYFAKSELLQMANNELTPLELTFDDTTKFYELLPNQNDLTVALTANKDGLQITKKFIFQRGSYLVNVEYEVNNTSQAPWKGYLNTSLFQSNPVEDQSSMFHIGSYTGASYSIPGVHRYQKVSFKEMNKTNMNADSKGGGWIAMQQHYFLTAWVPSADSQSKFYTRAIGADYQIGSVSQPVTVESGQTKTFSSRLYAGPESAHILKTIAPGLDLTVDYGWLWMLSSMLFSLMKVIYSVVGNWGWSIVIVTILIKLAFYRLSAKSYRSMANMRKLQPKLQALRERYGDDKAQLSQATMALYKQEKINPLGGCLPILVQIPVFIALYWVLFESVELRQAPFIFWIKDLASPDPYHVLPILMGFSMFVQQKLNPPPPDPTQAKIMLLLPVLFTGLFWNFPSGLVLYWVVNNGLSILQQWYITRKFDENSKVKLVPANK